MLRHAMLCYATLCSITHADQLIQVIADESLAHALQVHPLQLTVHKQSSSSTTARASTTAAVAAVDTAVPVGSTEVDLSALLVTR